MSKRFFNPHIGKHYNTEEGINGKKILVVGASFYCTHKNDCKFFDQCTSVDIKDSSPFDDKCPFYVESGAHLSDDPQYCIDDGTYSYKKFSKLMESFIHLQENESIWDYLAFTNYIQFYLPRINTYKTDISSRDFDAFCETLVEIEPDIVIVWGTTVNSAIKEDNKYLCSIEELQQSEYYVCHIKLPNMVKTIAIINPYHPSSRSWNDEKDKFELYLTQLINK